MAPAFEVEDLTHADDVSSHDAHSGYGHGSIHGGHTAMPTRHSSNRSTQRLGQYHIIKTLGEGSFGKVKLAVHQVSGQKVALKIISRRKLSNRDMAGRVEREIQYLQLLRHPHIIKLYTVITTQSEIIMVLEYAGGELFDYIVKHGKMAEDRARRFFQQIICAVEYCHRHKIVHRDLKPENLLLDENLNVKIADFGLSNIMTDGNFLKTSCGSPNYAAPEVISGKLYAGPEVDVWSCGVILYVLLVGRLPFDDEYIPSLFKKIAQGQFVIPNYLSPGAVNMIKKMLVVNPVHRIDVQEIRQDPWFNQGLADYLKPPVEDFVDTGVDPNKAIDPLTLAPGKPAVVQEKLHDEVVGKLGKTMGYAKDDVQEALRKDEPNDIKDAYLIVRENQIMRTIPSLAKDEVSNPYLATSPPPITGIPHGLPPIPPANTTERPRPRPKSSSSDKGSKMSASPDAAIPPPSKIGILPTSITPVWQQYVAGHSTAASSGTSLADPGISDSPAVENPGLQSPEQQASTARAIQGHTRSQINLARASTAAISGGVPESLTPLTSAPHPSHRHTPSASTIASTVNPSEPTTSSSSKSKPRSVKWQFGIRSRNTPHEALGCIYRALGKLGATWVVNDNYIPTDPYLVQVRWEKSDMLPAGPVGSAHNSSANLAVAAAKAASALEDTHLTSSAPESRRGSATPSLTGSNASSVVHLPPGTPSQTTQQAGGNSTTVPGEPAMPTGCYVYIDIQVYQLPSKFFMVDFKLDGYERIEIGPDGVKRGVGRRAGEDKGCTSPFPFLTMVSELIIALAEGE